jgi:hypothetical protein
MSTRTRPSRPPALCTVEVTIQPVAPTDPQMLAWRRLWALLLADEPENGTAPSGELEAVRAGTNHVARRTRSDT